MGSKKYLLKSNYETLFALYLYFNNISYSYESLSFEYCDTGGKHHIYTPDFIIGNKLYEVKGTNKVSPDLYLNLIERGEACIRSGYQFNVVLAETVDKIENYLSRIIDISRLKSDISIHDSSRDYLILDEDTLKQYLL